METKAKCPVCDWQITGEGIEVKVNGKVITVCCEECAGKVKEDPASHGVSAS